MKEATVNVEKTTHDKKTGLSKVSLILANC